MVVALTTAVLAIAAVVPLVALTASPAAAAGAPGTITTVWGSGPPDGAATSIPNPLYDTGGVAAAGSTMYVTVSYPASAIYRVDLTTGAATLVAGPRDGDGTTNGPALSTAFGVLSDVEVAPNGDVLAAERNMARVWRISGGTATVIAGTTDPNAPVATDHSVATSVRIAAEGVSLAPDGSVLIAGYQHVYRVDATGDLTLVAGNGTTGSAGDGGLAVDAQLNNPSDVLESPDGTIYIADGFNGSIRRIDPTTGIISTLAVMGTTAGLVFAPDGTILATDRGGHRVVRVALDGTVTLVAGNGGTTYNGDGIAATSATLFVPTDVAVDGSGRLLIDAPYQSRVRMVDAGGTISTVFGNGTSSFANQEASSPLAIPVRPSGLAVDSSGRIVAGDPSRSRVRRLDADGKVRTLAGNGVPGYSGDGGNGLFARIGLSDRVAVAPNGAVFLADRDNDRVRKIVGGTITTAAGVGDQGGPDTGPDPLAVAAGDPIGITTGADGSVYWVGYYGVVHQLHPDNSVTTIPFDPTAGPSHGQDGWSVAVDRNGVLFVLVSDSVDNGSGVLVTSSRVVRVATDGSLSTVVGGNPPGFSGDGGPAATAQVSGSVSAIATGPDGSLYLADTGNNRVRRITPDGTITTIAGSGAPGSFGDGGSATAASLDGPQSLAVDGAGRVYVGTTSRIRVIQQASSWVRPLGGATNDDAFDVRMLPDGAYAVVGRFTGTVSLGLPPASVTLTSAGGTDGYLAIFEADGRVRRVQRIGGAGADDARSVAVDAWGGVYVAGSIGTTSTFGSTSSGWVTTTNAYADAYVVKYTSLGQVVWARTVSGPGTETGYAVDVDASGNVWLGGSFTSATATATSRSITNAGSTDGFAVRYSSSGNVWFAMDIGGTGADVARAVAVRPDGSAAVGGYFSGTAALGTGGPTMTSAGGLDGYVAVIGAGGSALWRATVGGSSTDWVSGVTVTSTGAVGVAAAFTGNASVGGTIPVAASSGMDGLVARFAPGGGASWAVPFGGTGADNAIDLVGTGTDFLVAGVVSSAVSIGGTPVGGGGGYDGFTARLASGASVPSFAAVTLVATGPSDGVTYAVAPRSSGFVAVGTINGTATFGPAPAPSLTATGTDGFVFAD